MDSTHSIHTHEVFYPVIVETHSINSLFEAFEELKSLYQTDNNNELEINNNQSKSSPFPEESDAYSSDELSQSENDILTPTQIEKFQSIFNNTTEENDKEEQINMKTFLNQQDENAFKLILQTKVCCNKKCLITNVN